MIRAITLALLLISSALGTEADHRELARADGSTINYTLWHPLTEPAGVLLLAQGSGCNPAASNPNIAEIRSAFPDYLAVAVEKIGITPNSREVTDPTGCPSAFHAGYTLAQRLADYRLVLDHLDVKPADLVLFGGSEGGIAVATLAAELHPRATIILSSATGLSFEKMVLATVPPEGHAFIEAGFAAARQDPNGDTLFAGFSHRFWADMLGRSSLDEMRRTDTPFLLIQGGLDLSSPLAAARTTADAFAAEGRCNLTYWEFPALDHGLRTPSGNSRHPQVAALAAQWVRHPIPAC